jgi:hypothetical protein
LVSSSFFLCEKTLNLALKPSRHYYEAWKQQRQQCENRRGRRFRSAKEDRGCGSLSPHRQETRKLRNRFKTLGQM